MEPPHDFLKETFQQNSAASGLNFVGTLPMLLICPLVHYFHKRGTFFARYNKTSTTNMYFKELGTPGLLKTDTDNRTIERKVRKITVYIRF